VDYQKRFGVKPGKRLHLADIDPAYTDKHGSHKAAQAELDHYQERLRELQELLYVEHRHSLLICLQAMDTAGKDGTINHVLGAMNPQGCRVAKFRQPSEEEAAHDFLWRAHNAAPARGEVVIFNRSHYEDVLVVRVHDLVPKKVWSRRYKRIRQFEENLIEHDTQVLKFFLYISKDEQLRRFKARLDDPSKQWKISDADYAERAYWDGYLKAYEDALTKCSTAQAPWFVIPSDHKWFRNLAVARIVVERLEALKMSYPKPSVDIGKVREEFKVAKREA
jgi:PPK2 family polyphosphate:nucleotide phosphotransferase